MSVKRFRVLLVAVFAVMMIVALAACGSGGSNEGSDTDGGSGDAYALYNSAAEALQSADGYEMDMTIGMAMDIGEESAPTDMTSHIVVNDPSGNIEMKLTQSVAVLGQEMETTSYIKDGSLYTETLGQKIKMSMDAELLKAQASNVIVFPKDAIIDEKVDDAEGGKKISFTIKGEAMADYVTKQLSGTSATEGLDMSFGDAKISALIDGDGKMVDCTTTISYEMGVGAAAEETSTDAAASVENISADMTIGMSNIKIGKTAIDFPTDLDTYTEFDASAITDGLDAPAADAE